jgi:hypothetical protein
MKTLTLKVSAGLMLAGVFTSPNAIGWGKEGHQVVALIVFDNITPQTKAKLNGLFRTDEAFRGMTWPERMMEAAVCPDDIKSEPGTPVAVFWDIGVTNAQESKPLHYADHQGTALAGPPDKCVIFAINKCQTTLKDTATDAEIRLEALKFLIHFAGDVHEPLHAGNVQDKGGNDIKIARFLNRVPPKGFNLHEVWDDLIIMQTDNNPQRYADNLNSTISPEEK